jgi:hypothetical protein
MNDACQTCNKRVNASDVASLLAQGLLSNQVEVEWWWLKPDWEVDGKVVRSQPGAGNVDIKTRMYYHIEITFPPPKTSTNLRQIHRCNPPKSRGFTAWLWLFSTPSWAKAAIKPSSWPGLAWPIWARPGLAHGLRPGQAQHYLYGACGMEL